LISNADFARFAGLFCAIGTEPRLRILALLLESGPQGLVVGDIARELRIRGSTLSHHLEKLRQEALVKVQREGTFLRYSVDTVVLQEVLDFLHTQCQAANRAGGATVAAKKPKGDLHP
jgi:ArsR family transcriptional regulator